MATVKDNHRRNRRNIPQRHSSSQSSHRQARRESRRSHTLSTVRIRRQGHLYYMLRRRAQGMEEDTALSSSNKSSWSITSLLLSTCNLSIHTRAPSSTPASAFGAAVAASSVWSVLSWQVSIVHFTVSFNQSFNVISTTTKRVMRYRFHHTNN